MNENIRQLLAEIGIETEAETVKEKVVNEMQPIRYDKDIAIFTTDQIDVFGEPDLYGYYLYQVIEGQPTFATDFQFETNRERNRPIHRYNRVERFEFTLAQILGLRGDVPYYVMAVMCYADKTPEKAFNSIRAILKHYRYSKYYNRIPQIMFRLGIGSVFEWDKTGQTYQNIINDFKQLHTIFETKEKRSKWNRKYFPSLRFIAVKLLERYGATCNFPIDFIRTKRKQKLLKEIWEDFILSN